MQIALVVAQWMRVLAVKAQGPKFKPRHLHRKTEVVAVHLYPQHCGELRQENCWELMSRQSSSRFSDMPCVAE